MHFSWNRLARNVSNLPISVAGMHLSSVAVLTVAQEFVLVYT